MNRTRYSQRGAAHLILIVIIVVAIIGALGFVGYNALQRSEINAGGMWTIGNKKAPEDSPATVTVTFKATDWKNLRSAKIVNDAKHGKVLRITKNGMAADNLTFASITPGNDSRFKQLNDFNKLAFEWGPRHKTSTYTTWVCLSYQRTYTNQDIKKFPFVSTYLTDVGPFRIGGSPYDTEWHAKECKSSSTKIGMYGSLNDILKNRQNTDKLYAPYTKDFTVTTKTTVPDDRSANPPANGIITLGDLTITATFDRNYRP